MAKKNEKKNTKAAAEQSKKAEPVATVGTPDTTTQAGTDVEGLINTPKDGSGCEAVTVIIIDYTGHGYITAESVKANLVGVDCKIRIVDSKGAQVKTLLAELPEVETERIILMEDQQQLLTPVSIYDIGVKKYRKVGKDVTPEIRVPVLMHKSVLRPMLEQLEAKAPYADVVVEYQESVNCNVMPIVLDDWRNDPWLLPIVSEKPNVEVLRNWAVKKKFAWIKQWTPDIEKIVAGE